jgi:prevent-host-death family protein
MTAESKSMKVDISEAKSRLSQLIESARAGEEVVIAIRGEPVARLAPDGPSASGTKIGSASAILDWLKRNPPPPHARRSTEEIDAAIEAERSA